MDAQIRLTNRQLLVISCVLSAPSIDDGCKKARVSRTAYYSWLKDDCFKIELARQRDEMIQDALDRLKSAINKATAELVKLMDSSREDIRRLACKDIIEFGLRSIELQEIEDRLEKVEKVVLERKAYR